MDLCEFKANLVYTVQDSWGYTETLSQKDKIRIEYTTQVECSWLRSKGFIRKIEMAQQLGALAALAEDLVWFPEPTWRLTTILNFSSRGSNTLFWLPWMFAYVDAVIYMQAKH